MLFLYIDDAQAADINNHDYQMQVFLQIHKIAIGYLQKQSKETWKLTFIYLFIIYLFIIIIIISKLLRQFHYQHREAGVKVCEKINAWNCVHNVNE